MHETLSSQLELTCWACLGPPCMRGKICAQPSSSLSALFWKLSNPLSLQNLPTLHHFFNSHSRLWALKQGISVSPSSPLAQDLPHPSSLTQPVARTAVWSQLCAPCQKLLPKMKKKIMMFDKSNIFKTLKILTEIFLPSLPAYF